MFFGVACINTKWRHGVAFLGGRTDHYKSGMGADYNMMGRAGGADTVHSTRRACYVTLKK